MTSPNQNPLVETTTSWKPCTVMVTGASGFLGSHLCRHLGMRGGEVHAISRFQRDRQKSGPIWWESNLEDVGAVRRLFDSVKPDIIFHLSGLVSGIQSKELVLPTFHSLVTSTVNLLTVAAEVGCHRIVLAGSLNEPPDDGESIPSSPYAAAKWASSGYGRMFHALYGTPVVIVRTFMTYGPGQEMRKLIPTVARSLLKGESPKLSSGQWKADWIYVDDVIEGFLAAAQVPQIEGVTVDLGSGSLVTVRELVERLVEIVGKGAQPLFGVLPDRVLEPARTAEVARTFEQIDWKPNVSLQRGLQQTVEWYKAQLSASRDSQLPGHSNK
ncbi:NAD-dependent epimerase/dehydratase family protein [Nitrospira sp. T9]|uniref:NAD-dependent epimerase/dehydratase family protein n=1 Tax=unclassified Nitrospira TaxID=2652172 RepID=UPI003F9585EC